MFQKSLREQMLPRVRSSFHFLAAITFSLIATIHCANAQSPHERNFAFEYVTTVKDIPAGAKELELWLPVPHDDPYQVISDLRIESPQPYQIHSAQYGNKVLRISLKNPPPAGFTVTLRFNAKRREHINPMLGENHPLTKPKERPDPDMAR